MKASKSGLFLFELIVVIFLFAVASAVCISIFAASYNFSTQSENLTMSSLKAETVAEVFKGSNGPAKTDADRIAAALKAEKDTYDIVLDEGEGNGSYGGFTLHLYYDKNWKNTDELNHVYRLTVTAASHQAYGDSLISAHIQAEEKDKDIFQLNALRSAGNLQRTQ